VTDRTFLVLGGTGLVGFQVAGRIISHLDPEKVVISGLDRPSVDTTVDRLRRLYGDAVELIGEAGDVFVRADHDGLSRADVLADPDRRREASDDLLGSFDEAYPRSRLAGLVLRHRPEVVVDAVNTATAISYQDVYAAAARAKAVEAAGGDDEAWAAAVDELVLSQAVPQLIRHVRFLYRAMIAAGTRLYLKVGTTGTGGMGLNIPYTHSEDRPSAKLMTKTAVAFAHTGLLFLMARTAGAPIVKEIKPGALIGYAAVAHRPIRERGTPVRLHAARTERLGDRLLLRLDPGEFASEGELVLPVVDTGENGLFTRGEFEAITSLGQMELVTPEEVAQLCVLEIQGRNTGRDVVAALDGSIMPPSYRGGVVRAEALDDLRRLESESGTHSVALGQLGPPELSKLLWEAELLRLSAGTVGSVLGTPAVELAEKLEAFLLERADLVDTITSLGLAVLGSDGATFRRGPFLRIPEIPGATETRVGPGDRDRWAAKGWVDLRAENLARWQARFQEMRQAQAGSDQPGSAGITLASYLPETIEIGTVVAWVLANEHQGFRIM
jgi:hypothetical protein